MDSMLDAMNEEDPDGTETPVVKLERLLRDNVCDEGSRLFDKLKEVSHIKRPRIKGIDCYSEMENV